ncbi:unnamed protein product [Prorocentrum cordatum]|uniref:Uncharacterized protein n=1 Tax=Prorocentrum cordatum TaxID=2364126 RepID=A0ABN9UEF9_9DINO|nr:unnamed protein product [Polarella glacialis]
MGGYATWEIAAKCPSLFAAIAVVSGYHFPERRERLVAALCGMPIFVVHSHGDECCKFHEEVPLWRVLSRSGNPPLMKNHATGGHGSCWAHSCENDILLYDILLDHLVSPDGHAAEEEGELDEEEDGEQ